MNTIQITIQRKYGDSWPVVVEESRGGVFLPVRREGFFKVVEEDLLKQSTPIAYGTELGKALFSGKVQLAFAQALHESDDFLRVLLYVEAQDLRTLRWERICAELDDSWDFVALNQRTPFSLYLPSLTDRLFPPIGRRDLRALILAASPEGLTEYDLEPFDVRMAVESIQAALGKIPSDVLAEVDASVGPPTLDALCGRLTQESYTLLHVICHGQVTTASGGIVTNLFLGSGDARKRLDRVSDSVLIERLRRSGGKHGLPRLAFLSTCESASPKAEGAMGGLAQRLVRELGMPAVVGMTEKASVPTAQSLAERFYRGLREHGEVDRALAEATATLGGRYDITVPALFSRLGGRPLFSDTLDRELTPLEVEDGLSRLSELVKMRAPVLSTELEGHAATLRGALGREPTSLSGSAQEEQKKALDEINKLCGEVLDLSFKALALGTEPPDYDDRCPFRGLYPFRAQDREFFFGRDKLVEKLRRRLAEHNFLAVLGASGCGKSSLVMAGLLPALKGQEPDLQIETMTPGGAPLGELERVLAWRQGRAPVLLIDQFEELFTLCREGSQRLMFLDRLCSLMRDQRVVITMRADFWGECAQHDGLKEAMLAHQELIAPMSFAELREAMEAQARKVRLRFEADLSNTILDDVENEPGAMPLLQHTLLELWKRRHGRWLLSSEYREKIGGVRQAIARTADEIYDHLAPKDQERIRNIFIRLTRLADEAGADDEQHDTRRRCAMRELVPEGDCPEAVRRLAHHLGSEGVRLLVIETKKPGTRPEEAEVDVAHEALIRHWPRLRQWLNEDRINFRLRQTISAEARKWENSGAPDDLLPRWNSNMEAACELSKKRGFFTELEGQYLDACVRIRDREKLEREQHEKELKAALAEAQRQGRIATARQLAAESQVTLEDFPRRGVLLAVEALLTPVRFDEPRVPSAEEALRQALSKTGGHCFWGHQDTVNAVAISPNNRWLATGSSDHTVRLWDLSAKDPVSASIVLRGHEDSVNALAIGSDGRWLATGSSDHTVRLWDLSGKDPASASIVLRGHEAAIHAVAISPNNRWLATGCEDEMPRLWDLSAKDPVSASMVLLGHEAPVKALAVSPDSRWLATGSADGTARLWDLSTDSPVATVIVLQGHQGGIGAIAISPDGRWLATAGRDNTARLWSLSRHHLASPARVLRGHECDTISSVAISPDNRWLVTGSAEKPFRLWDLSAEDPEKAVIVLRQPYVFCFAISPDSRWLVTGSGDNTTRLWDLTSKDPGNGSIVLRGHEGYISSVAISTDNRWLVTASADHTARLWDLSSKEPGSAQVVFPWLQFGSRSVTISPDSRWLVTGTGYETHLSDLSADSPYSTSTVLGGHEASITALTISPDSRWLAMGSEDRKVRLWDLSAEDPAGSSIILGCHEDPVRVAAISPDSRWLVTVGWESPGRLWDLSAAAADRAGAAIALPEAGDPVSSVAFSPNSRWLVTLGRSKTARLWDLRAAVPGSAATALLEDNARIGEATISVDSRWLVTVGEDNTQRLWDLNAEDPRGASIVLRVQETSIKTLAVSPDGRWLVTVSEDYVARVWDLSADDQGNAWTVFPQAQGFFSSVVITSDSHWLVLACAGWDNGIRVWNLTSENPGRSEVILGEHMSLVHDVIVSPDSRWLVAASAEATASLWDLRAKDPTAAPIVLRGHRSQISAMAISPDSRWLVTGSEDKTARLWDLSAKDPASSAIVLRGHKDPLTALVISPDSGWLVTVSWDGTARLWDLRLDRLVDLACRTAGRNLTKAEWEQYLGSQPYQRTCSEPF